MINVGESSFFNCVQSTKYVPDYTIVLVSK